MRADWIGLRQSGLGAVTEGWISRILRHRIDDPIGPIVTEGVVTFYQDETLQIWTLRVAETTLRQTKKKQKNGDFRRVLFANVYCRDVHTMEFSEHRENSGHVLFFLIDIQVTKKSLRVYYRKSDTMNIYSMAHFERLFVEKYKKQKIGTLA